MKNIRKKLWLLVIVVVMSSGCVKDQKLQDSSNQSVSEKLTIIPKIGKEITTGYITSKNGEKRWRVREVEYDNNRYLILYPIGDITNSRNIVMVKK